MSVTKYSIDDVVLAKVFDYRVPEWESVQKCVVSMITITRKGIRYRTKTEVGQADLLEHEIIGKVEDGKID